MGTRNPISQSSAWQRQGGKFIVTGFVMLMLVFCCRGSAPAQVLYGSLTGTVTDSSGAAVAGAKVDTLNVATGAQQSATTDSSGVYRFSNLQQGTYRVTIKAVGFRESVSENVNVSVNNVQRVDSELQVASQTQEIVVTTAAQEMQTDNANVHSDLSAQQVDNLPTAGSQGGTSSRCSGSSPVRD